MLFIIAILLSCCHGVHGVYALQITEVMYNPPGADTGREWIEIYFNNFNNTGADSNLSNLRLNEDGISHNIYSIRDNACEYAIICSNAEGLFADYPQLNISNTSCPGIYRSSFSLSNTGEYLAITYNSTSIDSVNYSFVNIMNISEGQSIEYNHSSNSWIAGTINGTPGTGINEYMAGYPKEDINSSNTPNGTIDNTANNTTVNNTGNFTDNSTDNISNNIVPGCNISINIIIRNESMVYGDAQAIKFQNKLNITGIAVNLSYSIEYWVEDLDGNFIKNRVVTNNQDDKSFTPHIEESDKVLMIKNNIKNSSCNIINDSSAKIIIIHNIAYVKPSTGGACKTAATSCSCPSSSSTATYEYLAKEQSSNISIRNSSNNAIISIYRGNTQKAAIDILVDSYNDSRKYHLNIGERYCGITLNIPTDCNDNNILVNGLGINISDELNKSCLNSRQKSIRDAAISTDSSENTVNASVIPKNSSYGAGDVTGRVIYESPNQYNRMYAFIGIIFTILASTITFTIYKIRKKGKETSES